jgi:hypothetical protein
MIPGSNPGGGAIFRTRPDRPSLLYSGYRVSFPALKRYGRKVDHPAPSNAEVKEWVELYIFSPSGPSWPVQGWTLLCITFTSNVPTICIYIYIKICLPHSSYMFRCATHHLQGGLKTTCCFTRLLSMEFWVTECTMQTIFWAKIRVAFPGNGAYLTETCRGNTLNILLYKYMCAFICYIWGVIYENSRIGKNSEYW